MRGPLSGCYDTPKYRRKAFYGDKRREVGQILRLLCEWKQIGIVEAEVCPDHIHMLVEIPPKLSEDRAGEPLTMMGKL